MCGRCGHAMAPRHKRRTIRRRQPRRRRIKGGAVPFVVDVKKGFELLTNKDMWKFPSKAETMAVKRRIDALKRVHRNSGSKDSYDTWVKKKGYRKRPDCSLM